MRRVSNEPRQVRKEAAVVMRSVCCGVPGLFLGYKNVLFCFFVLPVVVETNIDVGSDKIILSSNRPTMEAQAIC